MTDDDLRALIYQHITQLTVAGENLKRAHQLAYAAAAVVFDDVSHRDSLAAARRAQRRKQGQPALPGPEDASVGDDGASKEDGND